MSYEKLKVNRSVLSPEIVQEATADALRIRRDIAWLGNFAKLYDATRYGVIDSPLIRVSLNQQTYEQFCTEAPGLKLLLEEIDEIPTLIEGVVRIGKGTLYNVTINYCDVGTEVMPHRDGENALGPKLSRIATLRGTGLFGIDDLDDGIPVPPITVQAGDLHELLNPPTLLERPMHWVKTIGDTDRISIAFQEPIEITDASYNH